MLEVKEDHTYRLDEEALRGVLLRDDIKDLPVVVVSVAGSYRGGKSFLLDFFLRYLNAPISSRSTSQWLGDENEPLKGFRWRGGCDRETTGIHLWSEPIHAMLNDKKVAVLLMDTQGTFDSSSTIQDCSTIFALSTLISSVQIYNIKENIKEDDFQNLLLFTEYGKLAKNEGGNPFQVLQFLVRDWPYPYQHAYGIAGGVELLDKRLEINKTQTEDMRELRQNIRSYFDHITAFLMPHPGFEVAEQNFDGRLSNIRQEFKVSLLELVPSIFGSTNLTPKTINGQRIKTRDLFDYFKTYMRIFNSGELPTPVSILKATSEAALLSAVRDASELYEVNMDAACGAAQPSATEAVLFKQHQSCLLNAIAAFSTKKTMASQKDIDEKQKKLTKDLQARYPHYVTLNEAKLQKTIVDVKKAYDEAIVHITDGQTLCVHPSDLKSLHKEALALAIAVFDANRSSLEGEEDRERALVLKELEDNFKELENRNQQNNSGLVVQARECYVSFVQNSFDTGSCVSVEFLEKMHEEGSQRAINLFHDKRNIATEHDDEYLSSLKQYIKDHYTKLKVVNKNANKSAVQAAVYNYNNYMASIWGPQSCCLHPDDLRRVHSDAKHRAVEEFMSNRTTDQECSGNDPDRQGLNEALERRYGELCEINKVNNEMAVRDAYNEYCRLMDSKCKPSLLSVLVVPWVIKVVKQLPEYHQRAKDEALRLFRSRRRHDGNHGHDGFLEELTSKLDNGFDEYCHPLKALGREFGIDI